jgi:hypothetical protein
MKFPETDLGSIALLSAEREIGRLIAAYPHLLDAGKLDEVAKLLQHATLEVPGGSAEGQTAIEQFLMSGLQRHEDGTPRTWHSVSNVVIEVDLNEESATSVCYFTVHQEVSGFPLQAICTGHYHDRFAKQDGNWHFVRRAVVPHLIGNLRFHVSGRNAEVHL